MMLATTSKDRAVRVVDGFTGRPLRKYMLPAAAQVRPSGVMAFGVGWPSAAESNVCACPDVCARMRAGFLPACKARIKSMWRG